MTLDNRNEIVKKWLDDVHQGYLMFCDFHDKEDYSVDYFDVTPFGSPYKMEYKVVCDKTNNSDESIAKGELRADFMPTYQMQLEMQLGAAAITFAQQEQKQVNNTTKVLVDEIASLKAEVAVLNARDIENKRVIEEAMKLNKELEKTLKVATEDRDMFEKDSRQWQKSLYGLDRAYRTLKKNLIDKYGPFEFTKLARPESQPPPPAAHAINKIGKTPHAAWHSIVDNENEGQL